MSYLFNEGFFVSGKGRVLGAAQDLRGANSLVLQGGEAPEDEVEKKLENSLRKDSTVFKIG
jgi:hypothetical protein